MAQSRKDKDIEKARKEYEESRKQRAEQREKEEAAEKIKEEKEKKDEQRASKRQQKVAEKDKKEAEKLKAAKEKADKEREERIKAIQLAAFQDKADWEARQAAATRKQTQPLTEEARKEYKQAVQREEMDAQIAKAIANMDEAYTGVVFDESEEVSAEQKEVKPLDLEVEVVKPLDVEVEILQQEVKKEPAIAVQSQSVGDYVINVINNLSESVQKGIENSKIEIVQEIVKKYPSAVQKSVERSLLEFWPKRIESLIQDIKNPALNNLSIKAIFQKWQNENFSREVQGIFFDIAPVQKSVRGFFEALIAQPEIKNQLNRKPNENFADIQMFITECKNKKQNPLYAAVNTGNLIYVKELLRMGYNPNEKAEIGGGTALSLAVRNAVEVVKNAATGFGFVDPDKISKETDMYQLLLMGGADPNIQDINGNTPLHYVMEISKDIPEEAMKIMVTPLKDAGALNLKNNQGNTPSDIEKAKKAVETPVKSERASSIFTSPKQTRVRSSTIVPQGEPKVAVTQDAGKTKEKTKKKTRVRSSSIASKSTLTTTTKPITKTKLHSAVEDADLTSFKKELNEANVNNRDDKGNTALHYAVLNLQNSDKKGISLLMMDELLKLEKTKTNLRNKDGKTALDYAKEFQMGPDIIEKLQWHNTAAEFVTNKINVVLENKITIAKRAEDKAKTDEDKLSARKDLLFLENFKDKTDKLFEDFKKEESQSKLLKDIINDWKDKNIEINKSKSRSFFKKTSAPISEEEKLFNELMTSPIISDQLNKKPGRDKDAQPEIAAKEVALRSGGLVSH